MLNTDFLLIPTTIFSAGSGTEQWEKTTITLTFINKSHIMKYWNKMTCIHGL